MFENVNCLQIIFLFHLLRHTTFVHNFQPICLIIHDNLRVLFILVELLNMFLFHKSSIQPHYASNIYVSNACMDVFKLDVICCSFMEIFIGICVKSKCVLLSHFCYII